MADETYIYSGFDPPEVVADTLVVIRSRRVTSVAFQCDVGESAEPDVVAALVGIESDELHVDCWNLTHWSPVVLSTLDDHASQSRRILLQNLTDSLRPSIEALGNAASFVID